jgi:hypothetical protein
VDAAICAGRTEEGYGIGFGIGELEGKRTIGHGGAIYGFATTLKAMPDDKLGVVVVTTKDSANAVTNRIADLALKAMLAAREGKPMPQPEITSPVDPNFARSVAGRYVNGSKAVDLIESAGKLSKLSSDGGEQVRLRSLGSSLVVDDKLGYGETVIARGGEVVVGGETFKRVEVPKPRLPLKRGVD